MALSDDVDDVAAVLAALLPDLPLLDALSTVMKEEFTTDRLVRMQELMAMARRYPTLEPYVFAVQERMRHTAQELLGSVAGDRYPGSYVPPLFGAVSGWPSSRRSSPSSTKELGGSPAGSTACCRTSTSRDRLLTMLNQQHEAIDQQQAIEVRS